MNAKQKISILALAAIALVASYWTGYIHGSSALALQDKIASISIALPIILIWTLAKLTFAFVFGRDSKHRPSGGSQPPDGAVPVCASAEAAGSTA